MCQTEDGTDETLRYKYFKSILSSEESEEWPCCDSSVHWIWSEIQSSHQFLRCLCNCELLPITFTPVSFLDARPGLLPGCGGMRTATCCSNHQPYGPPWPSRTGQKRWRHLETRKGPFFVDTLLFQIYNIFIYLFLYLFIYIFIFYLYI